MRNRSQLVVLCIVGFAIFFMSLPAFSQSCALCYTQAASAGRRMIEALRSGIIVLMIPPASMSVGISVLAYRKRNQFRDDTESNESERW